MLQDDPFNTVRAQVTKLLATAERQHTKWGEARRRKPVRQDECKLLLTELLASLEAVEADVGDLEDVLAVVEGSRSRFPHLDDAEVASRRSFVLQSRRATLSIREDLATHAPKTARVVGSPGTGGKRGTKVEREGLLANQEGSSGGFGSPSAAAIAAGGSGGGGGSSGGVRELSAAREDDAVHAANASYMESGMSMQQEHLEMQEEALDSLSAAVGNIKNLGMQINDELKTHKTMLDNLEEQVDGAADAMHTLKAKMKEMAKSKDRGKFCAICVLSIALFGLTSLVLYT